MRYKTTLAQKRFLIIWICIHSFALFVNLANINGETVEGDYNGGYTHLFTTRGYEDDFYPFTTFIYKQKYFVENSNDPRNYYGASMTFGEWKEKEPSFNGFFTGYNLPEYIFYILLGLGIIFLPKIWKANN